jgi:hypothetical protein
MDGAFWNSQGHGTLMEQTGMDYDEQGAWDGLVGDMDQQFKDQRQGAYKRHQNKTWKRSMTAAQAGPYHSKKAMDTAYRFLEALDLQDTTEEQDEILLNCIKYGTTAAGCMGGEETTPGYHWHEIRSLEQIETDEGSEEELILDVMQNGLMGYSTYITNPARQKNGKVYVNIGKLLDEHDSFFPRHEGDISTFESLTNGIIEIWLDQISNMDFKDEVCYSKSKGGVLQRYTIGQVFGKTGSEKRVYNRSDSRSSALTFRQVWGNRDRYEQAQAAIDTWNDMFPIIDDDTMHALGEMDYDDYVRGGKKRSKRTHKKRNSLPYAMTKQFERLY